MRHAQGAVSGKGVEGGCAAGLSVLRISILEWGIVFSVVGIAFML